MSSILRDNLTLAGLLLHCALHILHCAFFISFSNVQYSYFLPGNVIDIAKCEMNPLIKQYELITRARSVSRHWNQFPYFPC